VARTGPPAPSSPSAPAAGEDERVLLEGVRRGDPGAFDRLVTRYMRRAYAVAHRLLGNREDAEDLVQDAFLTVLARIGDFDASRPFSPWFFRILVNRGLNQRKARAVRHTDPIPEDAAARAHSPERQAEQAELRDRLRQALDALPERQRVIVELYEMEGFAGPEIAEILEISDGTVRWHLHEARRALRSALAVYDRKGG
jgi:RNA polymerase sigma-70 factor (ECF subfamily)